MPESHSTGRSAPAAPPRTPQTIHGVECYEAWREERDCPHEGGVLDDVLRHAHARAVLRDPNRSEGEQAGARTVLGLRDPRAKAPETMGDSD